MTDQPLVGVKITDLVHGGQGLGRLEDGKVVFVWNALPGETVNVELMKSKKDYAEGIAREIVVASKYRIDPDEPENYLNTSPWQILDYAQESIEKQKIISASFAKFSIVLPGSELVQGEQQYGYRNKMEYGFWADEQGIHLAQFDRGTHRKKIVSGSTLAMDCINTAVTQIVQELNKYKLRGTQLKSVILRANQNNQVVAALFVKDQKFPKLVLPQSLKGLEVYYSNPKSPSSVRTDFLYRLGDCSLSDVLLSQEFDYSVHSFFQGNLAIYEQTLKRIAEYSDNRSVVDVYSGVGSIGLSLNPTKLKLIEIDDLGCEMALHNAIVRYGEGNVAFQNIVKVKPGTEQEAAQALAISKLNAQIIVLKSPAEKALDFIDAESTLILDPPRAGLHADVCQKILDVCPSRIIYLSCNPSTQARDVDILMTKYKIVFAEGYNYFPRTPHIENLVVLDLLEAKK
jgi:23S rRNA (uracil1939-C5)-methyltransferase